MRRSVDRMTRTEYRVIMGDGKWVVLCHGDDASHGSFSDKQDAVRLADELARENRPARVVVHDEHRRAEQWLLS